MRKTSKLPEPIVWHEFGHIFGHVLVCKMRHTTRKIICISLERNKDSNPFISTDFKYLYPNSEPELRKALEDCIVLTNEILMLVMGAVFHITIFKKDSKVSFCDFEKISINDGLVLNDNNLYRHAGSDFSKIDDFLFYSRFSFDIKDVKIFAFKLQQLLQNKDIFDLLEPFILDFTKEYNGGKKCGSDLYSIERRQIELLISTDLIFDVNNLIKEHFDCT